MVAPDMCPSSSAERSAPGVPELGAADVLLGLIAADVALEHDIAVVRRADDLPPVLGELVDEIRDLGQALRGLGDVLT